MKIDKLDPPRVFAVGKQGGITIQECARISLAAGEQVTFVTPSGKRHDFVAKEWGFYATPSINKRLRDEGFKTALVRNHNTGRYFIMTVEEDRRALFDAYLKAEDCDVVEWLDERP